MMIRSRKVTRSAEGQPCTARFPGICNHDPATTVWAHLNGAAFGKGMGVKAHDILGFHGCFACHAYYDTGHGTHPLISDETLLECVLSAVCETYVRLVVAQIVIVPLDPEHQSQDRPIAARKPKPERKAIPKSDRPIPQRKDPWGARGTRKISNGPIQRRSDQP